MLSNPLLIKGPSAKDVTQRMSLTQGRPLCMTPDRNLTYAEWRVESNWWVLTLGVLEVLDWDSIRYSL